MPKDISKDKENKYILDIVDHFSKWYYRYLLKSKEGEEVLKKIEIFNPLTSPGEGVTVFTYPYLSAGAFAQGEAKGLMKKDFQ